MPNEPKNDPQLEKLMQQKAALDAKIRRQKAKLADEERKRDTRRKVLIGATLAKAAEGDVALQERIRAELDKGLTRSIDRELFDLPPLDAANDGAQSQDAAAAS